MQEQDLSQGKATRHLTWEAGYQVEDDIVRQMMSESSHAIV